MSPREHPLARPAAGGLVAGLVALAFTGDVLHAQGADAPDTGIRRLALEQYLQIEGVGLVPGSGLGRLSTS